MLSSKILISNLKYYGQLLKFKLSITVVFSATIGYLLGVDTFEITKIDLPDIHFRIACTKGTYIRSIAHDFGKAMHTGSYLSALRRTKIGNYNVHDATLVTDWEV